uniref:Inactive serine/threonine protein kinase TEX14 like n=1 Tax=Rhipicephalus appendiculatus TaxID=34631 RepID=A0A131YHM3_RHIAP
MASSTKLHDAVRHDRCRLISRLVAEGTPVDAVDASGNSALFVAITDGPVSAVPYLLQAGADPNFRCSEGATPVHAACRRGSRALLQQLLECGGDLRLRDASGRTPQDWALGHADPQCRRKLVAFINTKRALAYRFGDAAALLEDDGAGGAGGLDGSPTKGGAAAAASLRRRLVGRPAAPRRPWCGERIRADGGFGVVYCSPARETGVTTFVPFIASNYLYNSEENNIIWSGPQSLMQTMYWDKLKVSVKKSSLSGSHSRGPGSDILITELEKVRRLSFHPYLLWPLAVSPVQNMDDMLLVFECIHFGSLFDILHNAQQLLGGRGSLDHGRLLLVLQQTCEALLFLHSRQWVHGCVSSHCIYVVSPCLGKLGNFEFVQRSEDAEANDAYSPPTDDFLDFYCHWLAPEVLTGSRPTKMADLYQFCVVLWEVFTEEVPWGSAERAAVERAVTQEHRGLSHRSEIPPPLDTLVHAGLALDPAERHTDLEDVYQALAAIVQEGQGNVGFALGRLEQAGDTCRVKSTPGKPLPSRQASTVEVEHTTFVHRPTSMRRRAPSTIADDVSDTVEELISLADERAAPLHRSPPRRPNRSQPTRGTFTTTTATSAQADLLDSKFDQISLTSSLDPMEYISETPKVPTFSSRPLEKPSFEACTQTDPETPPPLRPRTRGFVPASERVSVSNIRTSSRFTDNLLLGPEEVPSAKTSSARVAHQPTIVTAQQQQPLQQSAIGGGSLIGSGSMRRTVRPCKPASHSYGVSPFAQGGASRIISSANSQQHRAMMDTSTSTYNAEVSSQQQQWRVRQGMMETRHRQQTTFASRGTNVCRVDDAILEGLGDGERYHKELVGRSVCAETSSQPKKREEEEERTLVADYSLPSGLGMMGDDNAEGSEVKSVQTEPHHAYKVEVVTMTCPVIQHTLTVTSTNLLTGETTVTEESTGADVVQVQWNPDQINITTPDTSLNSSAGAAGVPDVSPAAVPSAPAQD